ncbi:MAG: EAL domain-containing protein [Gammaproteobacteria bacterium]|nr:EAL domain-containing protein [Gammaproteobacteria bacterium]
MSVTAEKDVVFSDYAAFIRALLPPAQGLVCHDAAGRMFWSEPPAEGMPALTAQYREAVTAAAGDTARPGQLRIPLGSVCAYLLPLAGEGDRSLGVLTVFLDRRSASMDHAFLRSVLAPVLRGLQRELSLRFRIVDAQRKLQVQAAEERLLHQVEKILHEGEAFEPALRRILELCCGHLAIDGALLVIPDKHISLAQGAGLSAESATALGRQLIDSARAPGFDRSHVQETDENLWLPVQDGNQVAGGIFALRGWQRSGFSRRRLARVARYIGSHIESMLERDFDPLTGLVAWPAFERESASATADAATDGAGVVLCMNLDQLHVLNDTFGREAGDELLRRFAGLLREVLPAALISRATGDNFFALLRDVPLAEARRLAEEICVRARDAVYARGDMTYRATVSIGVGPLAADSEEAGDGLAAARIACKAAKERGRSRVEVYESADVSIIRRADDIQLAGYVRNAIENGRLVLVGQRLQALKPGRMPHYFEVLVRIIDDDGAHVSPAEFISAAERYQLMEELDRWVVARALDMITAAGIHSAESGARFAINLSGQSLGSENFLPYVESLIVRSGVAPDLLTFEITESVAVARMKQAQALMHTLKKLGCHLSLDDFGTGLSSFAYLKLFPVDTLKIDGSFIRDVTTNVVSQSVVAAIAEVARVMQLETVAEYVQDEAALELLRSLNISFAQGYVVGAAEPLEQQIATIARPARGRKRRALPSAG